MTGDRHLASRPVGFSSSDTPGQFRTRTKASSRWFFGINRWLRRVRKRDASRDQQPMSPIGPDAQFHGLVREALIRERLADIHDEALVASAAAVLRHDQALQDRARRLELERTEWEQILERATAWKRQWAALADLQDWAMGQVGRGDAGSAALIPAMRDRLASGPFTPQERLHIERCLTEAAHRGGSLPALLAAVQDGSPVPFDVFDPFAPLYGRHSMHVGQQWRVFDGEQLWTLTLCGIQRGRRRFLGLGRAARLAEFEVRRQPDDAVSRQLAGAEHELAVGHRVLRLTVIGGTATRLEVEVERPRGIVLRADSAVGVA